MRAAYRACSSTVARAKHDGKRLEAVLKKAGELTTPHMSEDEAEERNIFEETEDDVE